MAVTGTNRKKQEEIARQQTAPSYAGMNGVNANTARNMGNYQAGYRPSDTVQQAQRQLQQVQNQRPQSYSSKYQDALDDILKQIQSPNEFKYTFDGDEMFKQYADLYTQKGKQASMDAMGQAAALTGGYGNSFAQQAGQQGYQQYLLDLYAMGPQLRDQAYREWQGNNAERYNQLGALQNQDQIDYGRYRDTVGDWERDRDYWTNYANSERNFDYGQYSDMLNYWTGLAQAENSAWNTEQNRAENARQFDTDLAWRQETDARDYARRVLENDRNFDYGKERDTVEDSKWAQEYARRVLENDRDYWYGAQQDEIANNRADRQLDWNINKDARDFAYDVSVDDYNRAYQELQDQIANGRADRQLDWNINKDARDFAYAKSIDDFNRDYGISRDQIEDTQKDRAYYSDFVTYMLQNGQMPSADMLAAAGLSEADARAMLAQIAPAAGTGGNGNGGNMTVYESVNGKYYTINGDKVNEIKPENIPNEAIVSDRVIGKDWKSPQALITETMNSEAGQKAAQKWAEEKAAKAKTPTGNIYTDFANKVKEAQKKKKK